MTKNDNFQWFHESIDNIQHWKYKKYKIHERNYLIWKWFSNIESPSTMNWFELKYCFASQNPTVLFLKWPSNVFHFLSVIQMLNLLEINLDFFFVILFKWGRTQKFKNFENMELLPKDLQERFHRFHNLATHDCGFFVRKIHSLQIYSILI